MKRKFMWKVESSTVTVVTNWLAAVLFVLLLCWGGYAWYRSWKYTYTNDAQVTQYINPIIARVGGFVVSVHYQDHETMKRGDTLLVIDNREYQLEADQVQASISKENQAVNVLNSQQSILAEEHQALQQSIHAHYARVKKQQLEYNRYATLYEQHSATAQQLEDVSATLAVYKSELQAIEHKLEASQERVEDINVQKKVLLAERDRLYAAAGRKDLDVGYTIIRAPYDGTMGKRSIEGGQMVNPGQILGFIVNQETPTWVTANFKETQLRHLSLEAAVTVEADAFPGQYFKGKILSVSPGTGSAFSLLPPDNATGNFVKIVQRVPVRIELEANPQNAQLRSGMNVNVTVANE